jgi:hypothetical protein
VPCFPCAHQHRGNRAHHNRTIQGVTPKRQKIASSRLLQYTQHKHLKMAGWGPKHVVYKLNYLFYYHFNFDELMLHERLYFKENNIIIVLAVLWLEFSE